MRWERLLPLVVLLGTALLGPTPTAKAVEGMVLFTRGTEFGGSGDLKLVHLGGATIDIDSNVNAAVFSPDGQRVVYQRYNGSSWEIIRAKSDGSEQTVLSDGWNERMSFSWRVPQRVIFAHDYQYQLWELNPDTGDIAVWYTSAANDFWSVSVSADESRMTFYSRSQTRGIWIAEIASQTETHVHSGCGNAISPDGSRFTNNLGSHQDMYIRSWDTSIYSEIGITGEYWNSQRWSRNSDAWIIYSRGPEFYLEAYSNVYVRNIETDEEVQVTNADAHDMHRDFWVGTVSSEPVLQLDQSGLSFTAIEAGADPANQLVNVSNAGGGVLGAVSVQDDAPWLEVTTAGSGNSQQLSNSVVVAGLSAGSYSATVQVSSAGAANTSSYTVDLNVTPDVQGNTAPEVDAGPDQIVSLGQLVSLQGVVSDDGLPSDNVTCNWTKVSGPGNVVFFDASAAQTDVSIAMDGTYVLELGADDGLLQASDQVIVVVEPATQPSITLASPNGGEHWEVGSQQHIRWTTAVVDDVTIRYSTDNGATWVLISGSVDTASAEWMDYTWTVPDTPTDQAIIRLAEYFDANLNDDSNGVFTICAAGTCPGAAEDAGSPDAAPISTAPRLALGDGCACDAAKGPPSTSLSIAGLCLLGGFWRRRLRS